MDKAFIIAPKDEEQADAIGLGISLAEKLSLTPKIFSYRYQCLPNFKNYIPEVTPVTQDTLIKQSTDAIQEKLVQLAKEQVETKGIWCKHLNEHAVEMTAHDDYRLIIKAIRYSQRFIPTDWHLIRHVKVPLMLLANCAPETNNILVALDLDSTNLLKQELNKKVIKHAWALADAIDGTVHIAYVSRTFPMINEFNLIDNDTMIDNSRKRHAATLAEFGLPDSQIHIVAGEPETCLPDLCRKLKTAYLVMGARQRKGLMGHIIGNTSEAILNRSHSHVLVVPALDIVQ